MLEVPPERLQFISSRKSIHCTMSGKTSAFVPSGKVAFVTGANGISGHAIVEHLIRTPESAW
jgi:hypothetical protein